MIAADYQPLCAAANRRRDFRAMARRMRSGPALAWQRHRPRLMRAARVAGGLLGATIWFGLLFSLFFVPLP